MYLAAKAKDGFNDVHGYVMYDELKIHEGDVWGTWDGLLVGLASDMLDLKSTLHRLLSKGGDTVKKAKYVN